MGIFNSPAHLPALFGIYLDIFRELCREHTRPLLYRMIYLTVGIQPDALRSLVAEGTVRGFRKPELFIRALIEERYLAKPFSALDAPTKHILTLAERNLLDQIESQPQTVAMLANALGKHVTAINPIMAKLRARVLVDGRERVPTGGRLARLYKLTEAGQETLNRYRQKIDEHNARVLADQKLAIQEAAKADVVRPTKTKWVVQKELMGTPHGLYTQVMINRFGEREDFPALLKACENYMHDAVTGQWDTWEAETERLRGGGYPAGSEEFFPEAFKDPEG